VSGKKNCNIENGASVRDLGGASVRTQKISWTYSFL